MDHSLQDSAATLEREYSHTHTDLLLDPNELPVICQSAAYLAFCECGGSDETTFDWNSDRYRKAAWRIVWRFTQGSDSDSYDKRLRRRCRRYYFTGSSMDADPPHIDTTNIENQDTVRYLKSKLSAPDFELLDALYLRDTPIKDYAPIWAKSGNYNPQTSTPKPRQIENALGHRLRLAVKAARVCLAESA